MSDVKINQRTRRRIWITVAVHVAAAVAVYVGFILGQL